MEKQIKVADHPIIDMSKFADSAKSICRIEGYKGKGTGFFLKFPLKTGLLPFLMTNFHVIDEAMVNFGYSVDIYIKGNNPYDPQQDIKITLDLDLMKREIRQAKEEDYTIIEIFPKDFPIPINFLLVDIDFETGFKQYIGKSIFIPQHPNGDPFIKMSLGNIKGIDDNGYFFTYDAGTESGSSGSPIINAATLAVIGLHFGGIKSKGINKGTFLGHIVNKLNGREDPKEDFKEFNKSKLKTIPPSSKSKPIIINDNVTCFDDKTNKELTEVFQNYEPLFFSFFLEVKKRVYPDAIYYGECKKDTDIPFGRGMKIFTSGRFKGGVYKGHFINGLREGNGEYLYANGEFYKGQYKSGKYEGYGELHLANGDVYKGGFIDGKYDGRGEYHYTDGSVYKGQFKDGFEDIYGQCKYKNGDFYKGGFDKGLWNGTGELHLANGDVYKGGFKDGEYDGHGEFTWTNGDYFQGQYKNGKPNGYGERKYASSGEIYKGDYKDGKKEGKGSFYSPSYGSWREGIYKNGLCIKTTKG